MKLVFVLIVCVLGGGIWTLNGQLALATHSSSEGSSDKSKSDSNNQQPDTTSSDKKQSDVIPPIEPPTIPIPTIAASQTCSDGSDKNNDQICAAETNPEQTVSQPQSTPTPQVTQLKQSGNLENSLSTISTQDNDINDTTLLMQLNNSAQ